MTKKILIAVAVVVVLVLIYGFTAYNRFVSADQAIKGQWAQVQTQYQRRFDLIPNLVNSVKGILKQEQAVFGEIADARTRYSGATTVANQVNAANAVEAGLGRLLAIVENYPELKSSENIQTLMAQLEGTENRISVERQRYNDDVQAYNVMVVRFPTNIVARLFGFTQQPYFQAQQGAEQAPQVQL